MLEVMLTKKKPPPATGGAVFVAGTSFRANGGAGVPVTIPAGTVAGDFMVMFADSTGIQTTPAGWTRFKDERWTAYGYYTSVYYKVATASEANFNLVHSASVEVIGAVVTYRGATALGDHAKAEMFTNYTYPSVTATVNASTMIIYACDRSPTIPSVPAGMVRRASFLGAYLGVSLSDQTVNAGATGTRIGTGGGAYAGHLQSLILN